MKNVLAPGVVIVSGMVVLFLVTRSLNGFGQSTDEQQVRAVVAQLFKGMELGDSAMVHSCFLPRPTMATVKVTKDGEAVLSRAGALDDFLKAVGTPHAEKWFEETWNVQVDIDGQLAQVWCDYAFYRDNHYSHCGVDAFQLFKAEGTWKIFHLADTRRAGGCNIPAAIVKKHTP